MTEFFMKDLTHAHSPRVYTYLLYVWWILLFSCRGNDQEVTDVKQLYPDSTYAYEENDTPVFVKQTANLQEWMAYYRAADTGFLPGRFKASGVTLHLDSLPLSSADFPGELFRPLIAYSPDSSLAIDSWSYNQFLERRNDGSLVMTGGEADQEVSLINFRNGVRRQLMFNGPMQVAETADWISNHAFVISLMTANDSGNTWIPEIYLFNLRDSTFTNFRLNHPLLQSGPYETEENFLDFWLRKRKIIRK
jgi:hypothetical protein